MHARPATSRCRTPAAPCAGRRAQRGLASARDAGRDRGRPPRLLHVEPGAPRRPGDRRPAAGRAARRGHARRRPRATPTWCSRPARGTRGRRRTSRWGVRCCSPAPARCWGSASGMQGLVTAYGGTVARLEPAHGDVATIRHDGAGVFAGLPQGFAAVRYHSLGAVDVPAEPGGDRVERGRRGDGGAPPHAAAGGRAVPPRVRAVRARRGPGQELPLMTSPTSDPVSFFRDVAAAHRRCFWLDGGGAREWSGRRSIIGWLDDDDVSLSWSAARREVREHVCRDVDGRRRRRLRGPRGADPRRGAVVRLPRLRRAHRPARRPRPAPPRRGLDAAAGGAGVRARGGPLGIPGSTGDPSTLSGSARPDNLRERPTTQYADAFARVQEHLHAGNSYEVNLTHRLTRRGRPRPGDGVPPAARAQPGAVLRLPPARRRRRARRGCCRARRRGTP